MAGETSSEILSSRSRLKIADLLSIRPRTLGELAGETGISVQGVLKHLDKLSQLGLLEKGKIGGKAVTVRKLYSMKNGSVGDFSNGGLTIVSISRRQPSVYKSANPVGELESLAEDILVQKRRIREQARRLGRMIDEMIGDQEKLNSLVQDLNLSDEDKLVVQTAFTEETLQDAEKALSRIHGMTTPRRSIEQALSKARRNVKK
jgi:predicted transcriptional regulator